MSGIADGGGQRVGGMVGSRDVLEGKQLAHHVLHLVTPNHTVSIPAHVGWNRAMTAAICSWIFRRR